MRSGLGYKAKAEGTSSVAIGDLSTASGHESVAVGTRSQATGAGSVALGREARASGARSVALGADSNATRAKRRRHRQSRDHERRRRCAGFGRGEHPATARRGDRPRRRRIDQPRRGLHRTVVFDRGMNHSTVGSALSNLDGRVKTNTDSIAEIKRGARGGNGHRRPGARGHLRRRREGHRELCRRLPARGSPTWRPAASTAGSTDAVQRRPDRQSRAELQREARRPRRTRDPVSSRMPGRAAETGGMEGAAAWSMARTARPRSASAQRCRRTMRSRSARPAANAASRTWPSAPRGTDAVNLNQLNAARDSAIQQSNSYTDLRSIKVRRA